MVRDSGVGRRAARKSDGILLRRWFGCWIDYLVVAVLLLVAMTPFSLARSGDPSDGELLLFGLVCIAVVFGYYTLSEGLTGRTVGKLASGTIVVNDEGQPPGIWRALVRTILRLIEANPFLFGGIPAGICMLATGENRRLGDLAAGTYVVQVKVLQTMPATPAVAAVFD